MCTRNATRLFLLALLLHLALNSDVFNSCNRYTSFGYGYRDFFEIHQKNFSSSQVFYFEFFVKTSSDAHILLKSEATGDDGFEIVIGGGSNTFSQIRLLAKDLKNTMVTQKTEHYLSEIDYKRFWISMDRLGVISVGKEDDDVFLNWRFDNPFPINVFSFGSWGNTKADWRFGCKKRNYSEITENFDNFTPLRKLKSDLFTLYDPNALPVEKNSTLQVKINFQIANVQLSEKRGELSMHGYGDLKWRDPKMKWNPEDYNGIKFIYVPPFQIWTPSIRILNALAVDKTPLFDLTAAGVTAKYDGSIYWRPPFKSLSSCIVDLKYWPSDMHNCSVYFGFWMEPPNLVLTMMEEYETLLEDKGGSEWEIVEAVPFNSDHDDEENYGILYVELKRMQGMQTMLVSVPYIAATVLSMSSFWVSASLSSLKLHLSCGGFFVHLILLFLIGQSVPAMTKTVPRIVYLCSLSVVVSCFPILLFVFIKNIQDFIRVPERLSKLLNHSLLNILFCLPEQPQRLSEYANLNDEENKLTKSRFDALKLITITERIAFLVYLIILILLHTVFV